MIITEKKSIGLQNSTILNRVQVNATLNTISTLGSSTRRKHIINAFDLVILNLRENTGEVMLTRSQLAKEIGCSPNDASDIMNTLISIRVVSCEIRKRRFGRGLGKKIYFVNPHVAWKGSFIAFRAKIADSKPPFFLSM